jgi:RHS repeat-associated protein
MSGISSKALAFGSPENKNKYNGIEKEDDLGLEVYDAQFRELDAQVGRWWQIDPVTDGYEDISPYTSMYNNPLRYNDPLGNEGEDCCLEAIKTGLRKALITGSGVMNGVLNSVSGGRISSDPFSFRDKLSDEELELYDNSVKVGQIGTLAVSLLQPSTGPKGSTPVLVPIEGGPGVPIPLTAPSPPILAPPFNQNITTSSDGSNSSDNKGVEKMPNIKIKKQKNLLNRNMRLLRKIIIL